MFTSWRDGKDSSLQYNKRKPHFYPEPFFLGGVLSEPVCSHERFTLTDDLTFSVGVALFLLACRHVSYARWCSMA